MKDVLEMLGLEQYEEKFAGKKICDLSKYLIITIAIHVCGHQSHNLFKVMKTRKLFVAPPFFLNIVTSLLIIAVLIL